MKTTGPLSLLISTAIVAVFFTTSAPLEAQTFTNYTTTDGLVDNNVNGVAIDGNGNAWFGTNNGVSMFNGSTWTNFTTTSHSDLISDAIKCITVASNGDVWVGSNAGAGKYDGSSWTKFTEADGLGDNRINKIAEDGKGNIWFLENDGASVYDGSKWTTYTMADGLPFGGVLSADFDSKGEVWLGSGLGGLIHFDGKDFTAYKTTDGLVSNLVRKVLVDENDNKWVATAEGISVLDASNTTFTNHHRVFELPAPDTINPVVDLAIDGHKRVWAGIYVDYLVTEGGISLFEGGKWSDFDANDGLIGPVVRAIAVDANNDVWIATSSGVSKLSDVPVTAPTYTLNGSKVYPNPSNGPIRIDLDDQASELKVEVKNLHGSTVYSEQFHHQSFVELDLNCVPGMYIVELTTNDGGVFMQKILRTQ